MASTTVNEIIESTNADIVGLTTEARTFISALTALLDTDYSINIPGGRNFSFSSGGGMYEALQSTPARPSNLAFVAPPDTSAAPTPTVREATLVDVPDFAETPPSFDLPEKPTLTLPSEPSAPSIADVSLPVAPTVVLPSAPVIAAVDMPSAPTLTLPTFDAAFPETPDLLLRTDDFSYVEVEYDSDLLAALEAKLLGDVQNGGYGIEAVDEDALWQRARDRELQAGFAEEATVEARFAARGYKLIPGVAVEAVARAVRSTHEKLSEMNREISITRAELFRKTREMAIEKGISLETVLNQMHGFARERALNAARIAAEFGVTVFDALVRKHNAIVASHQAYVASYSERVRAVSVETDIFRTQVEAAIAQHRGNEQAVAVYNAQLQATNTLVALYRTQLDAAQVTSNIEKTKLEVFQSKIQAFVAQVGARSAQADLYRTSVQGEMAKAQIYQSQVGAYEARVRAAESNARLQNMNVQADIERGKIDLAAYDAQITKYRADLAAETERVQSLVSVYSADSDMFKAVLSGWEALFDLNNRANETFVRTVQEDTRLEQSAAQIRLAELASETEVRLKSAVSGIELYKDLLAAKSGVASAIAIREE